MATQMTLVVTRIRLHYARIGLEHRGVEIARARYVFTYLFDTPSVLTSTGRETGWHGESGTVKIAVIPLSISLHETGLTSAGGINMVCCNVALQPTIFIPPPMHTTTGASDYIYHLKNRKW